HPKYNFMVEEAIKRLHERGGSSRQKIVKYVQANFDVGDNSEKLVKASLKKGVDSGRLVRTSGQGASGSFKLSQDTKKEGEMAEKKAKAKERK
ncbi:predicted protein, partial [Nematostella vectensis]